MDINSLIPGTIIEDSLAVLSLERCNARNGKKYLRCELSHPSGKIGGKVWEDNFSTTQLSCNKVYRVSAKVESFNGSLTLSLINAWEMADESIESYLKPRRTLIFDIETAGKDFEDLDEWDQHYLLDKLQVREDDKEKAKQSTALYPIYGTVVAIGMFNPVSQKGKVLALDPKDKKNTKDSYKLEDSRFSIEIYESETALLEAFWIMASKFEHFVTYNGNGFDWPYLLVRSALNQVKVPFEITRSKEQQTDLMDKFKSFNSYSLEALCRAFKISNPKEKGVSGLHVSKLFEKGEIIEIANYVCRDVDSTGQLYDKWKTYMAGKIIL